MHLDTKFYLPADDSTRQKNGESPLKHDEKVARHGYQKLAIEEYAYHENLFSDN